MNDNVYLKDRGDKRSAGVDPRPRVVRPQGPGPVIQGHVALVHAVDGADERGDDDKDPDHREDPEEDEHGAGEAEASPRGMAARPLFCSVLVLDVEGVHVAVHVPRVPLLGGALGHVDVVHDGDKNQPVSQNGGQESMILEKTMIWKI